MRSDPPRSADHLELLLDSGSVPLGFVREDDQVYLVARERSAQWPVEALRDGNAKLRLPEGILRGRPELISEPSERERVLGLFREKYGLARYDRWYSRPARVLRVRPEDVRVPPSPSDYYRWLQAEFDNVADDYDRHILGNRINRLLRDRSLAWLRERFDRSHRLLEIGCGSGMETLPLLRDGHEILAVDISERMLEVVRTKARAEGLSERLTAARLPARDLEALQREVGANAFDGAYSTYGAMNCEPDLTPIPLALRSLLKPEGAFVAGVYNRWCLFEILGYSLTLQFGRAWGRRGNPVRVGSSRFCVDVYAHSVGDFVKLFEDGFRIERVEAVPVILPPSDLSSYAERYSRRFGRLAEWDAELGARWPLNRFGDHFLMTCRRA
jgi:SAM-dependent methyltransferase